MLTAFGLSALKDFRLLLNETNDSPIEKFFGHAKCFVAQTRSA